MQEKFNALNSHWISYSIFFLFLSTKKVRHSFFPGKFICESSMVYSTLIQIFNTFSPLHCVDSIVFNPGFESSRFSSLDMGIADFRLPRELVSTVPWDFAFEDIGVHQCWSLFKYHLLREQKQANQKCQKSSTRDRRLDGSYSRA